MKEKPNPDTEELRRENARLRGDLLTVARRISHDLRTPLGGILTTSEILKEILAENNSASAPLVSPIFDSAEEVTRLIERVSFILKSSANPLPKEQVMMDGIVFRAAQRLEGRILKKKAVVIEPAAWPEVSGVAAWLEVVWWNLLANAVRHGGNRIELDWREEKGEFCFWVGDNGGGVPAERREKLFQPFHTLHEPDASHGLGLSIVQRLMELQNGGCGYEPRAESGSCFYFTLPSAKT